jgi:hypothetical protein
MEVEVRLVSLTIVTALFAILGPESAYSQDDWQMLDIGGPIRGMTFSQGRLWTVQAGWDGLRVYDGEQWERYHGVDGMCWWFYIYYPSSSPDGIIWIPAPGRGVMKFDNNGTLDREDDVWTCYEVSNTGMRDANIFSACDPGGGATVWFGLWVESGSYTEAVVARLTGDSTWVDYNRTDHPSLQFSGDSSPAVMVDSQGRLWIAYQFDGVDVWDHKGTYDDFDDDEWIHFSEESGLVGNDVRALLEDESGNIWVGAIQGLSRYDGSSWKTVEGIPGPQVWDMDYDSSGRIWAGTNDGVAVVSAGGVLERVYGETDGLENPVIEHIEVDRDSGIVWCAQGRRAQADPLELYYLDIGTTPVDGDADSPYAYPNPWSPADEMLSFVGLDDDSEVKIFDTEGREVIELDRGQDMWDGKNSDGDYVPTGVYILKIKSGYGNSSLVKLAVIRK